MDCLRVATESVCCCDGRQVRLMHGFSPEAQSDWRSCTGGRNRSELATGGGGCRLHPLRGLPPQRCPRSRGRLPGAQHGKRRSTSRRCGPGERAQRASLPFPPFAPSADRRADTVLTEAVEPEPDLMRTANRSSRPSAGLAELDLDWVALRAALGLWAGGERKHGTVDALARSPYPLPINGFTARPLVARIGKFNRRR